VGKHKGKDVFRRPRIRCKDGVKIDIHGIGWGGCGLV
jgi:hypothetical protein